MPTDELITWREIGVENYRAGVALQQQGMYRGGVSRFYYAVFSAITDALGAEIGADIGQETPNHKAIPKLIKGRLTQFSESKRRLLRTLVNELYEARVDADYRRRTVDKTTALDAQRATFECLNILGVEL